MRGEPLIGSPIGSQENEVGWTTHLRNPSVSRFGTRGYQTINTTGSTPARNGAGKKVDSQRRLMKNARMNEFPNLNDEPLPPPSQHQPKVEPVPESPAPAPSARKLKISGRIVLLSGGVVAMTVIAIIAVVFVLPSIQPQFIPQHATIEISDPPATAQDLVSMEAIPLPVVATENIEPPLPLLEIQNLIEQTERLINQNDDAHLYLTKRIDNLDDVPEHLTALINQINSLEHRILLLEQSVRDLEHQPPAAIKTPPPSPPAKLSLSKPPFRLISIDRWQKKWNAVLEFEGKLTMIETPATVAGWQLVSINPASRTATFRNSDGLERELAATG